MAEELVVAGIKLDTSSLGIGAQQSTIQLNRLDATIRQVGEHAEAAQRKVQQAARQQVQIAPGALENIRTFRRENDLAAKSVQTVADIQARTARDPIYANSVSRVSDLLAAQQREQGKVTASTKQVASATDGAGRAMGRLHDTLGRTVRRLAVAAAAYLTFRTALRVGRAIFNTNAELEDLQAQLKTVAGGAVQGARAFDLIKKFAIETPFSVQGLTESLIRLMAFGVLPTEKELRGLGNISAAFGRDITVLTDAIVSGANGMIRPLRQFGIQASVSGNTMVVSFQGVQREIPRTTEALAEFVAEQGNSGRFSNAMKERMDGLRGASSNLKDAIFLLTGKIGEGGLNTELVRSIKLLESNIKNSDDLAISLGEGLAGGVRLVSESLRVAAPLMEKMADFLARFGDQSVNIAQPSVARVRGLETIQAVNEEAANAFRRGEELAVGLEQLNQRIEKAGRPHGRLRFALGGPGFAALEAQDILRGRTRGSLTDLEKQRTALEEQIAAQDLIVQAAVRRKRELLTGPTVLPGTELPELEGAKQKIDEIAQAVERLREGERGIKALSDAIRGTGIEFDTTGERVQLVESVIRDLAERGVGLNQVLKGTDFTLGDLIEKWGEYARAIHLAEEVERLEEERQKKLAEAVKEHARAMEELARTVEGSRAETAQEDASKRAQQAAEDALEARQRLIDELAVDPLTDFLSSVVSGTVSVSEAFQRMVQNILNSLAQLAINNLVTQIFGGILGGAAGGATTASGGVSPVFPKRARGGPLAAGQLAIVGEEGPELFVPRSAGMILPNSRQAETVPAVAQSAGETHWHVNANFELKDISTRDGVMFLKQHAPMIANDILRELQKSRAGRQLIRT